MKQVLKNKWLYFLLLICAIVLIAIACKDETTNPGDIPPEIPPISTFQMNFNAFPDTFDVSPKPSMLLTYDNWGFAAGNVLIWNTIIFVGEVVPVAAYATSLLSTPHQQQDGTWIWSDTVQVGQNSFITELHGNLNSQGVDWAMYISQVDVYSDFLWYSGHSNLALTTGYWTLNKSPEEPDSLLSIVWHRSTDNTTADIKYTNVEPGGDEYGGYIFYGISPDSTYDAFYNIFNAGAEQLTNIQWNPGTHDGRVRAEHFFEDTLWHCWDETLNDVDCEPAY